MSKLLLAVLAALLLPLNGWAADLSKSSSLVTELDPVTNSWTATCDFSVSGIDQKQTYSGVVLFQFVREVGSTVFLVPGVVFQVDPHDRTWTNSSPGVYNVTAKLKGQDVVVHTEVMLTGINSGDRVFCSGRIDPGIQPPAFGTTLFNVDMKATLFP
jgi:hypothetical protein